MPDLLVRSFTPFLLAFQPCFTQPSFSSFWALTCAWILCSGRRSLTRVIQSGQLGRFKHYCSFHRFFSQARWNLDDLGYCVFQLLLPFCPEVLIGAVDDTLARKSGRHIWGAGMHHDPLRSTQKHPFFSFGHSWVVLSLHVSFPFAPQKTWALPVLVRLYRKRKKSKLAPGRDGKPEKKQTGQATEKQYRTRPQLALEMIRVVAGWLGPRKLRVLGDSEYAGGSISRHLPTNTELISRMTMNAALYELPPLQTAGRGRRRKKGARLSNPAQMAQYPRRSWIKTTVCLYGHKVRVWYHLNYAQQQTCWRRELKTNHLGTPLSLGETETLRSSELRKPTPWRSPKWLRTEFSIAPERPLNKGLEQQLRSPIESMLPRPSTFPVRT